MSHWYCRRCRRRRLLVATQGNRRQVRGIEDMLARQARTHQARQKALRLNIGRLSW